jgi:hypothetical protein
LYSVTKQESEVKTFSVKWQNCFMQEGTAKIQAQSAADAEAIFDKEFGCDYMIICVVKG